MDTDLFEYIGHRIRSLRIGYRNNGSLSQRELARIIEVSPNTISRWETGTYRPSVSDLSKLAHFFGVPIASFFPQDPSLANPKRDQLLQVLQSLPSDDIEEAVKYAEFRKRYRNEMKVEDQ